MVLLGKGGFTALLFCTVSHSIIRLTESVRTSQEWGKPRWWKPFAINHESRDFDCDLDGNKDCGEWDWGKGTCANTPKCGYDYDFGDFKLDHACRCERCFDNASTAAADAPMDKNLGPLYYGRWRPWNRLKQTCATWLTPKNDEDVRTILKYAREKGYIVRPSGATHSAGGLVTRRKGSENVLVVSLAEYVAPDGWDYEFHETTLGQATAKVNAGWTTLQLYAKIRLLDYFLPTQTAGPLFAIGGIVANCVHGGNYRKGFLHQYVVKMRVMLADGSIKIIDDEKELRFWRNSYGLLGVILGVEFTLEHRAKFQQSSIQKKVNFTEADFWTFLKKDADADISEQDAPKGEKGNREALMGQFFLDPYEALNNKTTMMGIVWHGNENATATKGVGQPRGIESSYKAQMNEKVNDRVLGRNPDHRKLIGYPRTEYINAVRHWGGPKVLPAGLSSNELFARMPKAMVHMAVTGAAGMMRDNRQAVNDGFYAYYCPNVVIAAFFFPPNKLFRSMEILAENFKKWENHPEFEWNGAAEFRFLTVEDDAVLNPVEPGVWAISEFMSFPVPGESHQGWMKAYKQIEDKWTEELGARAHIGKFWGLGETENGDIDAYQQSKACSFYSDRVKDEFEKYRSEVDPNKLFYGGDAIKLLSKCTGKK